MQVIPFSDAHLAPAADLLAERHRRNRALSSELPERFEQPKAAESAIRAALAREDARGLVALDDGRLVAYLIGDMVIDRIWGRSGWIRWAGCAYDPEYGAEIVRDLYAALGAHWVDFGIFFHVALTPVSDSALIGAWFSLSFGIEQIHALQDLTTLDRQRPTVPPGITLHQAGPGDEPHLAKMANIIWSTQVKAPTWAVMMPETIAGRPAAWAELATDDEVTVWLAMQGDEPLAVQGYWAAETDEDNVMVADGYAHMSAAGTRQEARGQGLSTLLSEHVLHEARAAGYRYVETDWRSANLLASRFWPRRGYRPVFFRLTRRVDTRISWANGGHIR